MIKLIKIFLIVIYLLIFIGLIVFEVWIKFRAVDYSVSPFLYWMILIGWLVIIFYFKWESGVSYYCAFTLFICGSLFTVLGLTVIAETMMRISFIGFLTGTIQALVEYKKRNVEK